MHFTQAHNLPGIVKHGLLSRARLRECDDVNAYASSQCRLDEQDGAISVSISAINLEMFWAKDRACGQPYWVVLLLDPSILWTHRCVFHRRNAATKDMRDHRGRRDGPWGFSEMFSDKHRPPMFKGESYRAETGIPSFLPTYPDAEVQVFDPILPDLIQGAWVDQEDLAKAVQEQLDQLPGPERTTYLRPFLKFTNGHEGWLVP
nr:DarT ssDNA thymidine ADP-ribosyltransferase family protein [Siccirubricoccus soli]